MRKEFIQKLIFTIFVWVKLPYGSYPKKNYTDTETVGLVYNKFKIANNYANKTRR